VAYAWMAITLLFNQLGAGKMVVLQGLRKIKYLANAGISGSFLGLTVSLPLYYYFGIDGIVPAIIATSVVNMLRSWYFASKVKLVPVTVDRVTTLKEGKEMLWLGFMLSLSGLITTAAAYLLRIYIRETGGVDDVGLYNAGFAIIITYVGLVFTAMSTDYYPRLSGVALYNHKARKLINQQAEMAILILAPILLLLMVFIKWVVVLLYSSQFVSVSAMIQWATLGMFFKAASWSIAYVFLAKGEAKLFLWNELITNAYLLAFNVLGYKLMGLDGLGIAFLLSYVLYFGQVFLITRYKYRFRLSRSFLRIMVVQFSLALLCLLFVKLTSAPVSYIAGSVLILIASVFSVYQLNKKTGLLKRRPDLTHHHNHD
jgi:O-antigen/teichoic acid export membrane protein